MNSRDQEIHTQRIERCGGRREWVFEDHDDPSSFGRIRGEWEGLLGRIEWHSFFQTPQWNALWWHHFGKDLELFLILLRDEEGLLRGVAPLYLERGEEGRAIARFIGGLDFSDYLDFVIEKGSEKAFFKGLGRYLRMLKQRPQLDLHFVFEESQALRAENCLLDSPNMAVEVQQEEVCPVVDLPSGWEEYLKGLRQKDRHELRRKIRRAGSSGNLRVVRTSHHRDLEQDMDTFIQLHRKSQEAKRGFMNREMAVFFHDLARILLSERRLALYFLLIDGIPAASLFGIRYGDGLALYNSGFDPNWRHISPGIVLIGRVIQEAIDEGCRWFDFLRGNEGYKYRFGARDRWLYNIKIDLLGDVAC